MSGKIGFKFCYLNDQNSETEQIKYTFFTYITSIHTNKKHRKRNCIFGVFYLNQLGL